MVRSKSVIVVGREADAGLTALLSTLQLHGFQLVKAPSAEDVRDLVEKNPGVAVIAYDAPGENTAQRVLRIVADAPRKTPVIVLVNQGEFEQYYELMCAGAYDYFELANDPQVIERSVIWAAAAHAA